MKTMIQIIMIVAFLVGLYALYQNDFITGASSFSFGFLLDSFRNKMQDLAISLKQENYELSKLLESFI